MSSKKELNDSLNLQLDRLMAIYYFIDNMFCDGKLEVDDFSNALDRLVIIYKKIIIDEGETNNVK